MRKATRVCDYSAMNTGSGPGVDRFLRGSTQNPVRDGGDSSLEFQKRQECSPDAPWLLVFLLVTQILPQSYVRLPALGVAFVILAFWTIRDRNVLGRMPVPLGLLLFIAVAATSILWSHSPGDSFIGVVQISLYSYAAYYLAATWPVPAIQVGFLFALRILVVLSVLAELLARAGVTFHERQSDLSYGVMSNPNVLAYVCVLALIATWSSRSGRWSKVAWSVPSLALILFADSSGAWSYLAFAVLLGSALIVFRSFGARSRPVLVAIAGISGLAILNSPVVRGLLARVTGAAENVTLSGRTEIWSASLAGVRERPWFGFGFEGLREPGAAIPARMQAVWSGLSGDRFNAHNGYLDILLQVGGVGLLVLLGVFVVCLARLYRSYVEQGRAWLLVTFATILAYNATETRIVVPLWSWFVLVLIASVALSASKVIGSSPPSRIERK